MKKIFFTGWMKVLSYILNGSKSTSAMVKEYKLTYAGAHSTVVELERHNLINLTRKGRTRFISMTKDGKEAGLLCQKIMNKFDLKS